MEVAPCDSKGREYSESDDMFVDTPEDLVGKDVHFVVKVVNCRGLPNKYTVRKKITFDLLKEVNEQISAFSRTCTWRTASTWTTRTQ